MLRRIGRILFGTCAIVSLMLLVGLTYLWCRGYYWCDTISRSNATELPLTDAARALAQQRNFDAHFIAHHTGCFVTNVNGRLLLFYSARDDVTSRWDEKFNAKYVDRPIWKLEKLPPSNFPVHGDTLLHQLGFEMWEKQYPGEFHTVQRNWMIPIWLPMLACLIAPIAWYRRWSRVRHRRTHHLCMRCGYDLRESPQRCPECGAESNAMKN
jgi:hypothetical protein